MASASRLLYLLPLALIAAGLMMHLQQSMPSAVSAENVLDELERLREREDLNVLFLLVDTLRADRLSAYGYPRPTSPTIDALARTGIRFAQHTSQSSWTKASMASLWTSTYPVATGILRFDDALPDAARMPAEILKARGLQTAGIWRNGWVAPNFGFAQGFSVYHKPSFGAVKTAHRRNTPTSRIAGSDQDITDSAIEFIRVEGHRPWLLYLHYMDVHQYLSDETSALFGTTYSDIYDNSIHWVDRQIQALLSALDEAGLRDRTIVVLVADHGEAFSEHDTEGHAKDLYGEVIETPFVVHLPFDLEPGAVVESASSNVDVWPTIFDLLGEAAPEERDGRSLVPDVLAALRSEAPRETEPVFAHLDRSWGRVGIEPRWIIAATDPPYRLIFHPDGKQKNELYDLAADPLERENRYEAEPETAARLERSARDYAARSRSSWALEKKTIELDDMLMGQLRAIGYAIE
ncbi:MAG: sulfatase [Deltaproteobacteria bacterium]|nr:sulfatase [Deltaproteobacteria bacterium]